MSEWSHLDTYYRIIHDYLYPDRLISCVEGIVQSVVGVGKDQGENPSHVGAGGGSSQLCFVTSTVQARVLLGLLAYFIVCIILINIAWLMYGCHINDLFVRSGIGQPQHQPQEKSNNGRKTSRSPQEQNLQ